MCGNFLSYNTVKQIVARKTLGIAVLWTINLLCDLEFKRCKIQLLWGKTGWIAPDILVGTMKP